MKLKKTLAIIMTATLAMATMTGCSQTTMNYSKEISNTSKWEAVTADMQGTIDVEAMGQNIKLNMTSTCYSVGGEKTYTDMKFNDPAGKINIPEVKMYTDNGMNYISKSYYESIYTLNGQPIPTGLANLKADYIAVDLGAKIDVSAMKSLFAKPDGLIELSKNVFGNSDIDLPYVQNGREYTLNLDANQTVDLAGKTVKAVVNNIDSINSNFKLGLTADAIKEMKTGVNDQTFNDGLTQAKTALSGSNISVKESFADDNYKQDINVNLQAKDFGKMSLQLASTSTKSEVKAIDIPTNKVKLTQEELTKLMKPETTNTNITKNAESGISSVVMSAVK